MRIDCPYCGPRDVQEFTCRGDASPVRPDGLEASAQDMHVYLHERENPAGRLREHWYHAAGCHVWLVVTRDTRTHSIEGVAPAHPNSRGEIA